ncbi:calcium-binding protein [Microvirga flavescens]|uniref:calcium-binding protein n=1 Tax=Microvirga flavescens TaxID=2249811 RepID=UPI000DDA4B06|nr:calcium-binding protein [Microvirga flavescens]
MPAPAFWGSRIDASSTDGGAQYQSSFTALNDGTFVGVWVDEGNDGDVWGQLFNADGSKKGDVFKINTVDSGFQINPVVTALKGGGFAVAFASFNGTDMDVRARVFDRNAQPINANEITFGSAAGNQTKPAITAFGDGFIVSHLGYNGTTGVSNFVFNATGTVIGTTAIDGGTYLSPSVAVTDLGLYNGLFLTAAMLPNNSIVLRSQSGSTISSEWFIPSDAEVNRSDVRVTALKDGKFIVTWIASDPFSKDYVQAVIYGADGVASQRIDLLEGQLGKRYEKMAVTVLADGGFAIAVQMQTSNDIIACAFASNGTATGASFTVHPGGNAGTQSDPTITGLADGRFIVGWSDDGGGPGAPPSHIKAQIFDPRGLDINWTGTDGSEQFAGSNGSDILHGGAGNDSLYGGAGTDGLHGDAGADYLDGGADWDYASYEFATSAVTVNLEDTGLNTGDAAGDAYSGIEAFVGSSHNDTLIGANERRNEFYAKAGNDKIVGGNIGDTLYGELGHDTIEGGAGNDSLNSGEGDDRLDGGAGLDTLVGSAGDDVYVIDAEDVLVEEANGGTDTVFVGFSYTLGANFENLSALEAGAINLTGNNSANTLTGNASANVLNGLGGNDMLIGGAGSDTLAGGAGDDTYISDGTDVIVELAGEGYDTVFAGGSYTLHANIERVVASGSAALNLTGNTGANVIEGNAGNNKIAGGLGLDTLTGGLGKDIFVFDTRLNKNTNLDRVLDFNVRDDSIYLENKYMTKIGKGSLKKPLKIDQNAFWVGSAAHDADDRIIYNKKTGALSYDADGTGSIKAVQIAVLSKNLKMTYADIFVI